MHIGMISTYPPTQCGIATYSSYLVSKLEALNAPATVDVISPCGDGEDDSFSLSRADGSDLSERLFNTVVKLKPDVVHIQHEYGLYDPSRGLAITPLLYRLRAQGIPVVVTLHSVYETFSEYQKLVVGNVCHTANAVIVHEEYQRESIARAVSSFGHVHVIPHGVRVVEPVGNAKERLGMTGKKIILLCGYFRPMKGFHRIVSLFPRIVDQCPSAQLVVAGGPRRGGETDYSRHLLSLISSSPAKERITLFKGPFSHEVLDTILSAAEVVVLPYEIGSQSGILAHCLAFGRPMVLSSLPSFKTLIERASCGFIAQRDDEFVSSILKIITRPALARAFSENAGTFVRRHLSWRLVAEKHAEIYRRIVGISRASLGSASALGARPRR